MTESNYNEITSLLCDRLSTLTNSNIEITPDTNLISQLSIDSIKLLNLIMEIEDILMFQFYQCVSGCTNR